MQGSIQEHLEIPSCLNFKMLQTIILSILVKKLALDENSISKKKNKRENALELVISGSLVVAPSSPLGKVCGCVSIFIRANY